MSSVVCVHLLLQTCPATQPPPTGFHHCCAQAQLVFGHMGIPVLVSVLMDDRDDLELLQGALECLVHAMAMHPETESGHPGQATAESQAGAVNAELFARKPEHVSLLLSLLEDEPVGVNDFYVRYHTVQLLTALLQVRCMPAWADTWGRYVLAGLHMHPPP